MTSQEFCYWLQGLFEVGNPTALDERQTQIIKDHLALVFTKVTPDRATTLDPRTGIVWDTPNTGAPATPPYYSTC